MIIPIFLLITLTLQDAVSEACGNSRLEIFCRLYIEAQCPFVLFQLDDILQNEVTENSTFATVCKDFDFTLDWSKDSQQRQIINEEYPVFLHPKLKDMNAPWHKMVKPDVGMVKVTRFWKR